MSLTRKIIIVVVLIGLLTFLIWYTDKIRKEKTIFNGMSERKFKKTIEKEFKDYRFAIMRDYLRWSPRPVNKLRVVTVEGKPVVERIYGGSYQPVNESSPEPLNWVKDIKLKSIENGQTYKEQLENDLEWLWREKPRPSIQSDIGYIKDFIYSLGIDAERTEVLEVINKNFK